MSCQRLYTVKWCKGDVVVSFYIAEALLSFKSCLD